MPANLQNVMERIRGTYDQLTASERKVADYVADHQQDAQPMSISELAEASGVAEATITRFCRKLGYKGYNAFKLALANLASRQEPLFPGGEIMPEDGIREMGRKRYGAAVEAISQTLTLLDSEQIGRAADILTQAGKVLCIGQGSSAILAMEAARLFSTAGLSFFAVSDFYIQTMYTAALTERDAVLLFCSSDVIREPAEILELAHRRRIPVVLVTCFSRPPACETADVVLQYGGDEDSLESGRIPARLAQLFLMDVLCTEVCRRRKISVEETSGQLADLKDYQSL